MNDSPKIHLSTFEEQLVADSGWLLTKNAILEKIKNLLGTVQERQQQILLGKQASFPVEVLRIPAKITRGENYLGLPWLVLDLPRYFDRQNTFAIRTMFWWGNFFSTTLQLSGVYKDQLREKIIAGFDVLQKNDFSLSHNASPWDHHFERENYRRVDEWEKDEFIRFIDAHPFIKLAKKIPLENWDVIDQKLQEHFQVIVRLLA